VCRNLIRKAKAHLELNLARNVQGNENCLYKHISSTRKTRTKVGLLLKVAEDFVTKDMEKAEVLNTFFTSVFTGKTCLRNCRPLR